MVRAGVVAAARLCVLEHAAREQRALAPPRPLGSAAARRGTPARRARSEHRRDVAEYRSERRGVVELARAQQEEEELEARA